MQPAGAHRFILRRIGLYREENDLFADDFRHVLDESIPDLGINRWIFYPCVGEYDGVGVDPFGWIERQVGDQVIIMFR